MCVWENAESWIFGCQIYEEDGERERGRGRGGVLGTIERVMMRGAERETDDGEWKGESTNGMMMRME